MAVEHPIKDESGNAERILSAALTLFAEKGYAGTSVREIVQVADVTNPMVYYYFGNKEGLFRGLLDAMQTEFHEQMFEQVEACSTPEQFVQTCVSVEISAFCERPEAYRFIYSVLFGPAGSYPDHDMFERHLVFAESLNERWRQTLPSGVSFDCGVDLLFGLVHAWTMGAIKEWENTPHERRQNFLNQIDGEAIVRELSEFFLRGIGMQ